MKYRAMVADPKTGREFVEMIPANDEAEAKVIVKQKGLLLTKLEVSKDEKASQPIQYASPAVNQIPSPAMRPQERYPRSTELIAAIRGVAIVSYAISFAVLMSAVVAANDKTSTVSPFHVASLGISLCVSALLLHATSAILRFVRDIAENSFKH